jgi:hypothetical protein
MPHFDYWRKRNRTKIKCFLVLWDRQWVHSGEHVSAPELARLAKVSPGSLRVLLKRWTAWGYVNRRELNRKHSRFGFFLTYKGYKYLMKATEWYPPFDACYFEVFGVRHIRQ